MGSFEIEEDIFVVHSRRDGMLFFVIFFILTSLIACRTGNYDTILPTATSLILEKNNSPLTILQSPVITSTSSFFSGNSPVSTPVSNISGAPFQFEKPIIEGATEIKGSGPPNTPVQILDVTFMGIIVTKGKIDADGRFVFTVSPLVKGHRLGLTLDNLVDANLSKEAFKDQSFYGDEAIMVPQVGFFYDTARVLEIEKN